MFVSKEKRKERMLICKECPEFSVLTTCKICGCVMTVKTLLVGQECPQGKWKAEQGETNGPN